MSYKTIDQNNCDYLDYLVQNGSLLLFFEIKIFNLWIEF